MNDQEFDAIFRRAAEQHRVAYNPGAWEKMRRKLDRAATSWGTSGKLMGGFLLLLLIGGIIGVGGWYQHSAEEPTVDLPAHANRNLLPDEPATPQPVRKQPAGWSEDGYAAEQGTSSRSAETEPAQAFVSRLARPPAIGHLSGQTLRNQGMEPGRVSIHPVATVPADIPSIPAPVEGHPQPARWRVSLGVSPDLSAINLGEASQVGAELAIGLEFFIRPRFSIQSGVIFSNKLYQASGESYKPYPGYWEKHPVPSTIDARCDVLDIPLNLRYYGIIMPQSSIFVSGGVSSYLMLTEDYVYRYASTGYQKPYSYKHQERNANRHYFKVANISLGYERTLSKRWALQVEPFVKIPVAGVGFGKIKLSTTGMFVTLNYRMR